MKHLLVALSVALCASFLPAQLAGTVCITGRLEPVQGFTICQQGETHHLADTAVYLKSSTVNMVPFEGQIVHVVGRDIGVTCRVLDVSQITPAAATLTWCGSPSTCCPIKLKLCPGGIGRGVVVAGTTTTFQPVGCGATGFLDGTLLIANSVPIWVGVLGTCADIPISVPCDNSLVGAAVLFQGARQDIGPIGPLVLTNVVRIVLAPYLPPCAPTNC